MRSGVVKEHPFVPGRLERDGRIFGHGLAVNDHEFSAVIGSGQINHAYASGFCGKSKMVLREKAADRGTVGGGIFVLHVSIVAKTLHIIAKRKSVDVYWTLVLVFVGHFVSGKEVFELDPVEALDRAGFGSANKKMLFGFSVPIERNDLSAYVAIGGGKGELGGWEFAGNEGLSLDVTARSRARRVRRNSEKRRENNEGMAGATFIYFLVSTDERYGEGFANVLLLGQLKRLGG